MVSDELFGKTLDGLFSKTHLSFPCSLDADGVRLLIAYIARDLPGSVTYEEKKEVLVKPTGMVTVQSLVFQGSIYDMNLAESAKFKLLHDKRRVFRFPELILDSIPGYSLDEHRPRQVALWDEIGTLVQKYWA